MKKIAISLILFTLCVDLFAQAEASNWLFGYGSGISFSDNNSRVTAIATSRIDTNEGCASISDSQGNLLFYTDGITVWNRNNLIMQNGLGLLGDPSSTQSAIIVPAPSDTNIYYIFTVDDHGFREPHDGLNYSIVDMNLDSGFGGITNKNITSWKNVLKKLQLL